MARNWTPAQRSAIDERSRTLLVSAAAGSGKTAVLTERIISSLTDPQNPTDISRLLVVTFTRAAAQEMRARIARALGDAIALYPNHTGLRRQLMLLGGAKICTIDSFYLDLVRANFEEAGFSPSFRLADEGELLSLRRDTMNAAIDRMYAAHPEFVAVADLFSDVRNEQSLTDTLLKLEEKLQKLPEGFELLLRSAKENEEAYQAPFLSDFGRVLFGALNKTVSDGIELYDTALSMMTAEEYTDKLQSKFGKAYSEMLERLQSIKHALDAQSTDDLARLLIAPLTERVTSAKLPPCSEDFALTAEACKAFREKWRATATTLGVFDTKEIQAGGAEAAELLRLTYLVLTDFDKSYRAAKREREVAEFGDVSRAAYHLLLDKNGDPTPLASSLADSFDAVYIDEYQDVDAMQDATFRAISTPRNRFMVGDIKQSIYRFRGADPAVFAGYRGAFPNLQEAKAEDTAATVFMSNCFRCDENIIKFSNTVSGYLFKRSAQSIGYKSEDDLCFSKALPRPDYTSPKCRVLIYDDKAQEGASDAQQDENEASTVIDDAEAKMIVKEIKHLLLGERKADGTRITPGDIAVLARGSAFAAPLAKLLREAGIPVNDTSRENFFENPEVLCMYSLLAVIDNPFRDVYLAAVMRSPFFGFALEELVSIRTTTDPSLSLYEAVKAAADILPEKALCHRIETFLAKLTQYRAKAELLPVDKLLRYLYRDTAVLSFAGESAGEDHAYRNKRQNLLRLYEYARCFEAGGFKGLYRFVRYVEDIMQNDTEMPTPEGPRDAISLITIHHSKGLEYPVCFVATTGKTFNADDTKEPLLLDGVLGCGTRVPNVGAFSRANTFAREAVKERLKQLSLEEEMRVLYVAMTRARERLYITGKPRYGMKNVRKHIALATCPATSYFELLGNSYLEWILFALEKTEHSAFCEVITVHPEDLLEQDAPSSPDTDDSDKAVEETAYQAARERFAKRFDFTYPASHLTRLPAKLSVSRLTPEILDVYDKESIGEAALKDPDVEALLHTFERTPQFEKDKQDTPLHAAERGTATHEFLQFCDFTRAKNDLDHELERLIEARFLPPEARDAIRREELGRFFESDFYKTLKNARDIHRETRFNVFLPAADFTENEELKAQLQDEKLLVQGVIDLFFTDENGNLVLCDYKTDRLPKEATNDPALAASFLFARHKQQLSYYKQALKAICGRTPDKTVIYSLPFGEALEETL